MEAKSPREDANPYRPGQMSYGRKRLYNFILTVVVMIVSVNLYYLGFFGTYEGPLHPQNVGRTLAGWGVTPTGILIGLIILTIMAFSWDYVLNGFCTLFGFRLTCAKPLKEKEGFCDSPVKRTRITETKSGTLEYTYLCLQGHRLREARFHRFKKGRFGHTLWLVGVVCCAIWIYVS
ncbi:MAG: hypothetical protein AB1641_22615 [Thermodesulfobacteriota bacterium]